MSLKENIFYLHSQGYSYSKIQEELGCSKGTVSYYLGDKQKEKNLNRGSYFKKTIRGKLSTKFFSFLKYKRTGKREKSFGAKEVFDDFIKNPICYLTGDLINLEDTDSYQFDHIIPRAKGGLPEKSNLGLCSKYANIGKADLSAEEYINFCEKVLRYNKPELFK